MSAWGRLAGELARRGAPTSMADDLIAAPALVHGLKLGDSQLLPISGRSLHPERLSGRIAAIDGAENLTMARGRSKSTISRRAARLEPPPWAWGRR